MKQINQHKQTVKKNRKHNPQADKNTSGAQKKKKGNVINK